MKRLNYDVLAEQLDSCEKGSAEEYAIYERMTKHIDDLIIEFKELLVEDLKERDGCLSNSEPSFLDDFAAPMDNLSIRYIENGEFEKAITLIEKILPVYRTLEMRNPNYAYQRYYAMERMIKCYKKLGLENLAILYEFEKVYLWDKIQEKEKSLESVK